ncbi:transposase [Demequina lutea]|uniref:Transposase n=1 Tax=Demequina lutea TaxID=431489 RepID=A0A7Y9Z8Y6_9MICO|nr:transposase [Demequina lutea]
MRLVREAMSQETSLSMNAAVVRVGHRVGVNSDTLRGWVKQARINAGEVAGVTTTDAATIKALEREVRELKRANEILLAASSFFARELDPRLPF